MPAIVAVLGAVATGLVWWLMWGNGLEYLEHRWRSGRDAKADAQRRAEAIERKAMAPLRSISDPRDAATVLMLGVARLRGEITPEQKAAIESEMRNVLGLDAEVPGRLAYGRFAAEQALSAEAAVEDLAPLLREKLDAAEIADLVGMLERVAAVHGGPTDRQEGVIGFTLRRLGQAP